MYAVRAGAAGKLGIVGDDKVQAPRLRDAGKGRRERDPAMFASRAQDDEAAGRKRPRRRKRIGDAIVVREEDERRQCRTASPMEARGRSCQPDAREFIPHSMPSSAESGEAPSIQALRDILARIEAARKTALAPAPFTTLVAVSKAFDAEAIRPVLAAGQRCFGENRVQEAKGKWPALKSEFPDVALHLIGPLQTNKVREAVDLFDAIHSLDRPRLAEALRAELDRSRREPVLFIQVNTGEEPQKAGVAPRDVPAFVALCRDTLRLPVRGLMCIPPADEAPAPHFALLAKLARAHELPFLSMGMSADFEMAVRFGATHVRVGTAIFGARAPVAE